MVGSGDYRPSLSQVADTVSSWHVKLRVDSTSAGSGTAPLIVTRLAGVGLEGQVTTSEKYNYAW